MNKVILTGNLTQDPQKKIVRDGMTLCTFSIAVNRRFKSGDREVDFIPISTFGKIADLCHEYLRTGSKVGISGTLQVNSYEVDGVKRTGFNVIGEEVEFLSPKNATGAAPRRASELEPMEDEDSPF